MRTVARLGLCLGLFAAGAWVPGQAGQPRAEARPTCTTTFAHMLDKLEANYIALAQMRMRGATAEYEARTARYLDEAARVESAACTHLMDDFLDLFGDGHLSVFERPEYGEAELEALAAAYRDEALSADSLATLVATVAASATGDSGERDPDDLAGLWTDGRSRFVVHAGEGRYEAHIVRTTVPGITPGELKASFTRHEGGYRGEYVSYGHAPRYLRGGVFREGQVFSAGSVGWRREPATPSRAEAPLAEVDLRQPSLDRLDAETTLLTIPSFALDGTVFQAFLDEHAETLAATRTLVIDIRGNRGGNGIYFPLIEFYATRVIEGSQGLVLASDDNLAYFRQMQRYSRWVYAPVVQRMEAEPGRIVAGPFYPPRDLRGRRETRIAHVAIVTDGGSISAAESFILHSRRASTLVTTFGAPTGGVIDYTSVNSVALESGARNIHLRYPTGTLHERIPEDGYNATGIVPDIAIPESVADPIAWVVAELRGR